MNKVDLQLSNLATEIELHGRSGHDSIYKNNVAITFRADEWQLPQNVRDSEVDADLNWFLRCADTGEVLEHLDPYSSFWLMQFGTEAKPYGAEWDVPYVLECLTLSEQGRRAVFTNSSSTSPCVLSYQFHNAGYNRVDMTVFMRSSDVVGVLGFDASLAQALLKFVCKATFTEPGDVTFLIGNAHVRWEDTIHGGEFTMDDGL